MVQFLLWQRAMHRRSRAAIVSLCAASCALGTWLIDAPEAHAQEAARGARADGTAGAIRVFTLREAVAYARAHQPEIRVALARIAATETAATVPRSQWLPSFGATLQVYGGTANNTTASTLGVPTVDLPRIGGTRAASSGSWQPYPSTLAAVGANQELFDFGRIAAQAAASDAIVAVEKQRAEVEVLDTTFGVEEAYFAVYAAKSVERASEDAFDRSRMHRDLAMAGVRSGLRSPIELTRAEADLAKFDIGRIKARGGVVVAESVLAAAIGIAEPQVDVSDTAPTQADVPALRTAIAEAEGRDPRVKEAIVRLRAEEQRTRAIAAEARPDVSLTATLSGRAGGADPSSGSAATGGGWIPNVANWDIGAVLSWPIFDATIGARVRASTAVEQVRREELARAKYDQVAGLRLAYGNVRVARDVLPGLQHAVDAAVANYAQADARFKAGLGTSVELADAEAVRADAEIHLALGAFEIARARAAFGRAVAEGL